MNEPRSNLRDRREVHLEASDGTLLRGELVLPQGAKAIVLFAHGSGSNRRSPRNRFVASRLQEAGYATLLLDLTAQSEDAPPLEMLAERLAAAKSWLERTPDARGRPIAYFGASTGAAVALLAAGPQQGGVFAVISRGGRPDLVPLGLLSQVQAPTLFLVGSLDTDVLTLNRRAQRAMRCERDLQIIPGASHLFEEPGTLEEVAERAIAFLDAHVADPASTAPVPEDAEEDPALDPREDGWGSYRMRNDGFVFEDRKDAGQALARALAAQRGSGAIVLGVPRGGVPVAYEVAKRLELKLDVAVARKLGAPGQEELAIGAVTSDGTRFLNDDILQMLKVSDTYLARVTAEQSAEARRRERRFRAGLAPLDLTGRSVIVIDDGLATGATMRAIVRSLRGAKVARLTVAIPVGAPSTCRELAREVDELVCLNRPEVFHAVGAHYEHFDQTSDEEVERLLRDARKRQDRHAKSAPPPPNRLA